MPSMISKCFSFDELGLGECDGDLTFGWKQSHCLWAEAIGGWRDVGSCNTSPHLPQQKLREHFLSHPKHLKCPPIHLPGLGKLLVVTSGSHMISKRDEDPENPVWLQKRPTIHG